MAVDLPLPGLRRVVDGMPADGPADARVLHLDVPGGRPLRVRVTDLGLACCALEAVAAHGLGTARPLPRGRDALAPLDVVVVAGTLTDALAPALARTLDARPPGAAVVAFGSCASCGGPYLASFCGTNGVD